MKAAPGACNNQAILSQADISLNGSLRELERLTAAVAEFCAANALDDEAEFQLNLVLEELFVNAVRHGGCEGMTDAVRVHLQSAAGGVAVEFRDCGRLFDPSGAPPANVQAPLAERQGGGLGIYLVREIMRDLYYVRDGEWNVTRMRREATNIGGATE
ncbi:MAG: ATP-binding protein [Candidatus Solibacter sp.]